MKPALPLLLLASTHALRGPLRLRIAREWSDVVAEFVGGAWRGSVAARLLLHDPHGRPAQVAPCLRCLDTVLVACRGALLAWRVTACAPH